MPNDNWGGLVSLWGAIAWLVVALIVLVFVVRWFGSHLRGLVLVITGSPTAALYVYFSLLLPGTLVHELSHLLVAKVLGVKTGRLSLGPKARGGNTVQFGALEYKRPDVVRESLIGVAPLVVGSSLVFFLANWRLGLDLGMLLNPADIPMRLGQIMGAQDAWVWIYFITAISNAMLPSEADRRAWLPFGALLAILALVLYLAGALTWPSAPMLATMTRLTSALAFAFSLTVLLDLFIGGIVWGLEVLAGLLLNRRVTYL